MSFKPSVYVYYEHCRRKKISISLWESREHPNFELEVMFFLIVLHVFIGKDSDEDQLKNLLLGRGSSRFGI